MRCYDDDLLTHSQNDDKINGHHMRQHATNHLPVIIAAFAWSFHLVHSKCIATSREKNKFSEVIN